VIWVTHVQDTHYILGTVFGPHPYPSLVKRFVSVIGREARRQLGQREGRLPDVVVACVGGGSNAMGIFHAFLQEPTVELVGVEAGGEGIETGKHAARFQGGRVGIFQGAKSYVLQDENGQIRDTYSLAPGLDYASVGPEHSYFREKGRVTYTYATDEEVLEAFLLTSPAEGIIPALESSHAIAYVLKHQSSLKGRLVMVNLSGRGIRMSRQFTGGWRVDRIRQVFHNFTSQGRRVFIPYLTAGDPSPSDSLKFMNLLAEAGAGIVELGIPFSDPIADGPVIQRAMNRALAAGTSIKDVFRCVEQFRTRYDTPVILMGYLNPVYAYGPLAFARDASQAGVTGGINGRYAARRGG